MSATTTKVSKSAATIVKTGFLLMVQSALLPDGVPSPTNADTQSRRVSCRNRIARRILEESNCPKPWGEYATDFRSLPAFLHTFAVRGISRIPVSCMAQFRGLSLIVLAAILAPSEASERALTSALCPGRARKKYLIPGWMPRLKVLIVPLESTFLLNSLTGVL
jgi:hypothetical protein